MPEYPTPEGATREDILRALSDTDPHREITAQLDALDRLEDWIEEEKRKWRHADQLAHLLIPTGDDGEPAEVVEPMPPTPLESSNGTATASEDGNDDRDARPTRRQAITRILEDNPGRSHKLSEIVAEIERRGWAGDSAYEDSMVLRTLATMMKAGTVKRPRKGYYKLVGPRKAAPVSEADDD